MTNRWVRRLLAGLAAACAAATVIACSNYQPNKITFQFTPMSVTSLPNGTPVSLDAKCNVFIADEVLVGFDPSQLGRLKRWMADIGFAVRGHGDPPAFLSISVPLGAVPDAIALIAKQPGVRYAESNAVGGVPEEGSPGERYFGCKTPR